MVSKQLWLCVFVFVALSAQAVESFSQLRVLNRTNTTLLYIFVSPSSSRSWGLDLVSDEDGVPHNQHLSTFLPLGREECREYDLLARAERGSFFLLPRQELCGGWNELVISEGTSSVERHSMALGRLTVHNDTEHDVLLLYSAADRPEFISPSAVRSGRSIRALGSAEFFYAHDGLESLYLWALDSASMVHELRLKIDPQIDEYELELKAQLP